MNLYADDVDIAVMDTFLDDMGLHGVVMLAVDRATAENVVESIYLEEAVTILDGILRELKAGIQL